MGWNHQLDDHPNLDNELKVVHESLKTECHLWWSDQFFTSMGTIYLWTMLNVPFVYSRKFNNTMLNGLHNHAGTAGTLVFSCYVSVVNLLIVNSVILDLCTPPEKKNTYPTLENENLAAGCHIDLWTTFPGGAVKTEGENAWQACFFKLEWINIVW